jgi:hypothetical protein
MNVQVSKAALIILIISLVVFFELSHIMYARSNENVLAQIAQQQSLDTNRLINLIYVKQKELDTVKNELEKANIKLATLAASVPVAVKK